jgi:hypothetical protein
VKITLDRCVRAINLGLFLFLVLVFVAPLAQIAFRLYVNGAVKDELVQVLRERYPAARFGGVTSYRSPVISLLVEGVHAPDDQKEMIQWLAKCKAQRASKVTINVWFLDQKGERSDQPDASL